MYTLEFNNHVHSRTDPNTTVRLGTKWADRLDIGDQVVLTTPQGKRPIPAEITGVYQYLLGDIPLWLARREHDPACRDYDGLVSALNQAYPNQQITEQTKVAVIQYVPSNAFTD
jgi:hypothetical protein